MSLLTLNNTALNILTQDYIYGYPVQYINISSLVTRTSETAFISSSLVSKSHDRPNN